MEFGFSPETKQLESLNKLNLDNVNPISLHEESYGGYNALVQTNQDEWDSNDKLYADI